jgi:hypothetical protein
MAALERKPMRINGTVNEDTDKALFDALSNVTPYKRMALLRRLANVGLMVEHGRLAGGSLVAPPVPLVPLVPQTPASVAVSEAPSAALTTALSTPSTLEVSKPPKLAPDRVVTANPERRSDAHPSANEKPSGPHLALMGRMNLAIMD